MKYQFYALLGLFCHLFFSCAVENKMQAFSKLSDTNWDVFVGSIESGFENVTRYPSGDRFPDISVTGDIVFSSDRKGSFNLYLMDSQGANMRPLSHSPFPDVRPRWSPDGKSVLFVSERKERNENLYLINTKKNAEAIALTEHKGADYEPAWHPNGKQIVFISEREDTRRYVFPELFLLNIKTKKNERLTQNTFAKHSPAFSKSGQQIAFSQFEKGHWQIIWGTLSDIQKENVQRFVPVSSKDDIFGVITDVRWLDEEVLFYTQMQKNQPVSLVFNTKTRHGEIWKKDVRERAFVIK